MAHRSEQLQRSCDHWNGGLPHVEMPTLHKSLYVRTVPGLCLLSLPIQWSVRECFVEFVLCTEIGIV